MNRRERFCGDCEGMAHDVGDDDHAYELVEESSELMNHVRTVDLGGGCGLLQVWAQFEKYCNNIVSCNIVANTTV
jgi:hypothetical protein